MHDLYYGRSGLSGSWAFGVFYLSRQSRIRGGAPARQGGSRSQADATDGAPITTTTREQASGPGQSILNLAATAEVFRGASSADGTPGAGVFDQEGLEGDHGLDGLSRRSIAGSGSPARRSERKRGNRVGNWVIG